MHITRLRYGWVPPITESISFEFDERVNVLTGPNATGKSTTMLMIDICFNGAKEDAKFPISRGMEHLTPAAIPEAEFDESSEWSPNVVAFDPEWDNATFGTNRSQAVPPVIYIGPIRSGLPGIMELANAQLDTGSLSDVLACPFGGITWYSARQLLRETLRPENTSDHHRLARRNLGAADELADACSMDICGEVIKSSGTHNYIPGPDHRGYLNHPDADPNRIRLLRTLGIDTTDPRNFRNLSVWEKPDYSAYREGEGEPIPIYLGHLSGGTEGTLLWMRWLALKMLVHHDFADGWDKMPAVLLIDEIENHLHPTWQRRVIPALLKHFPGLQIFATTHSPFVVAGLEKGQVHLLNRDENGVVTATTNTEDIVGWTADEILRTYMGVDDPTDDATASAARKLRELRDEGLRATADAEAERQTDMQKQRQLVDRDLLAGGPKARRREDFAERFREALERRRQTEEFNQENG